MKKLTLRNENLGLAHSNVHAVLAATAMLHPQWMRKHAFIVKFLKKGNVAADGLELCERWHSALVQRLNADKCGPIIFAIDRKASHKQVEAALLVPTAALNRFRQMKLRGELKLIEKVKTVDVRSCVGGDIGRSLTRSAWSNRMWSSLYPRSVALDANDIKRTTADLERRYSQKSK